MDLEVTVLLDIPIGIDREYSNYEHTPFSLELLLERLLELMLDHVLCSLVVMVSSLLTLSRVEVDDLISLRFRYQIACDVVVFHLVFWICDVMKVEERHFSLHDSHEMDSPSKLHVVSMIVQDMHRGDVSIEILYYLCP